MDELLAAAEADEYGDDSFTIIPTEKEGSIMPAENDEEQDAELDVDDKALVCNVVEFFPQDNKLCYRIENENNLKSFRKRSASVIRKFEDFAWLHERLSENPDLEGVLIPYLPPKVTWVDVVEAQTSQKVVQPDNKSVRLLDQFQKRALQLQRFLQYACRHRKIREDLHFVVFLEYEDDLCPKVNNSWFDGPTRGRPGLLPDDKSSKDNAIFVEVLDWTEAYKKRLGPAVKTSEDLSYSIRVLAGLERVAMQEFHDMYIFWKQDEAMSTLFRSMSKGLAKSQLQHHYRAEIEDSIYDVLLDHTGWVVATEDVFARRCAAHQRCLAAERATKKASGNRALEAGHSGHGAALKLLDEAEATQLKEKEQLEKLCATAKEELDLARKRRVADFKAVFVRLAELEIAQASQRHVEWSSLLEDLQAMMPEELPDEGDAFPLEVDTKQ